MLLLILPVWGLSVEVSDPLLTPPASFEADLPDEARRQHWRQAASDFAEVFAEVAAKRGLRRGRLLARGVPLDSLAEMGATGMYERDNKGYECLRSDCNNDQQQQIIDKEFIQQEEYEKAVGALREILEVKDMPDVQKMKKTLTEELTPAVQKFIDKLLLLKDSTFMNTKNQLTKWKNKDMMGIVGQKMNRTKVDNALSNAQTTFKNADRELTRNTKKFKTDWRKMIDKQFNYDSGVVGKSIQKADQQVQKDLTARTNAFLTFEQQMFDRIEHSSLTQGKAIEDLNDKAKTDYATLSKKVDQVITMGVGLLDDSTNFGKTIEGGTRAVNLEHNTVSRIIEDREKTLGDDNKGWDRDEVRNSNRRLDKAERNILDFAASQEKGLERAQKEEEQKLAQYKQFGKTKLEVLDKGSNTMVSLTEKDIRGAMRNIEKAEQAQKLEDEITKGDLSKVREKQKAIALAHEQSAADWFASIEQDAEAQKALIGQTEDSAKAKEADALKLQEAKTAQLQDGAGTALATTDGAIRTQEESAAGEMAQLQQSGDAMAKEVSGRMAAVESAEHSTAEKLAQAQSGLTEEKMQAQSVLNAFNSNLNSAQSNAFGTTQTEIASAKSSMAEQFKGMKNQLAKIDAENNQNAAATIGQTVEMEHKMLDSVGSQMGSAGNVFDSDESLHAASGMESKLKSSEQQLDLEGEAQFQLRRDYTNDKAETNGRMQDAARAVGEGPGDAANAVQKFTQQAEGDAGQAMSNMQRAAELESGAVLQQFQGAIATGEQQWEGDQAQTGIALSAADEKANAAGAGLNEDSANAADAMMTLGGGLESAGDDLTAMTDSTARKMASEEQDAANELNRKANSAEEKFTQLASSQEQAAALQDQHMMQQQQQVERELVNNLDAVSGDQTKQVKTMVNGAAKLERWVQDAAHEQDANAQKFLEKFDMIQGNVQDMWGKVEDNSLEAKKLVDGQSLMAERSLDEHLKGIDGELKEEIRSRLQKQADDMAALQKQHGQDSEAAREALLDLQAETKKDITLIMAKSEKLGPSLSAYKNELEAKERDELAWLKTKEGSATAMDRDRREKQAQVDKAMKAEGAAVLQSVTKALVAAETLGQSADDSLRQVQADRYKSIDGLNGMASEEFKDIDTETALAVGDAKAAQSKVLREGGWAKSLLQRTGMVMNSMETTLSGQIEKLRLGIDEEKERSKRYVESMSDSRKALLRELDEVLEDGKHAGEIVFTNRLGRLDTLDQQLDTELQGLRDAGYTDLMKAVDEAIAGPGPGAQIGGLSELSAQEAFNKAHAEVDAEADQSERERVALELDEQHAKHQKARLSSGIHSLLEDMQTHFDFMSNAERHAQLAQALSAVRRKREGLEQQRLKGLESRAQEDQAHRQKVLAEQQQLKALLAQFQKIRHQ